MGGGGVQINEQQLGLEKGSCYFPESSENSAMAIAHCIADIGNLTLASDYDEDGTPGHL